MKIRIVRTGLVYDLSPMIATYLLGEGLAIKVHPEPTLPKARVDLRKFREFINEHREGKKTRPA